MSHGKLDPAWHSGTHRRPLLMLHYFCLVRFSRHLLQPLSATPPLTSCSKLASPFFIRGQGQTPRPPLSLLDPRELILSNKVVTFWGDISFPPPLRLSLRQALQGYHYTILRCSLKRITMISGLFTISRGS